MRLTIMADSESIATCVSTQDQHTEILRAFSPAL